MQTVTINISKARVYDEVSKTTSYMGVKLSDESYVSMLATADEQSEVLDRFWKEASSIATSEYKQFINAVNETTVGDDLCFQMVLELSQSYTQSLNDGMTESLLGFFVSYITSKWCKFANKSEAESYMEDARVNMLNAKSKLYYRAKPTRTPVT